MRFGRIVLPLLLGMVLSGCASPMSKEKEKTMTRNELAFPPLPVLSPTALTGDAGDGRAYLRWNPQLEDSRVVGWKVLQLRPQAATITTDMLVEPSFIVSGLTNGTSYTFAVVGILKDGQQTPQSNSVAITPRNVGTAKVAPIPKPLQPSTAATPRQGSLLTVGKFQDIALGSNATRIVFPDGQELIYDNFRPVDWKSRDGEHLLYPLRFGNGLDIGKFDLRGLGSVIPPEGAKEGKSHAYEAAHAPYEPLNPDYRDAQFGTKHPYITDPMTLPMNREHHDAQTRWFPPKIDGDRVTFHYWQPLAAMGYRSWSYVLVWETWWPIERDRHGAKYHGLARLVEVEMPSPLKDGYQVMLNNGFGPGGTRQSVVSYSSGFRRPAAEVVDFTGDTNRQVFFQHPKPPRSPDPYHPDQDCLQGSPLIFYDWGAGSLTIAARSLYYHCANNSSSYIEQGADGVWPNLAWDMAIAGQRTPVDTVEYLYTSDTAQPLPQRYLNARFEAYGDVSRRMGLQDKLAAVTMKATLGQLQRDGGPVAHAEKAIPKMEATATDAYGIYHDLWHAVPVTVDDAYRLDEQYDCNPAIKAMCDKLKAAGIRPGFWFRPEFVKTSIVNALSDRIPTAETYYGYREAKYPDVVKLLNERGIPIVRQNPQWVRLRRDGTWPYNTPYQWVPMSMATDWWDKMMWPTLVMSRKLGFDWVLQDGGFGGLAGVEYAPMLAGNAPGAVASQPYWWRMFRSMHCLGIDHIGECTLGWKGADCVTPGEGDEYYLWMLHGAVIYGNRNLASPQMVHKLHQLYNCNHMNVADPVSVIRYARAFYEAHRAPHWIELVNPQQGKPVEVTVKVADSPVAGGPTRISEDNVVKFTVRPWTWTDVIWHYDDGTQAVYPAYEKIDRGKP